MVEEAGNDPAERGEIVRQFRPHWRVLLAVGLWTILAIAAVVLAFNFLDGPAAYILAGLAVVGWATVASADLVNYFSTTYTLTTDQIIVKTGVLKVTKAKIPLESIDNITMTRNVAERMLGYGDMIIESTQGRNVFADIPDPEAFEAEVLEYRDRRTQRAGTTVAPAGPRDAVERLSELADLHERGALTDAEFEAKKAKLLEEI